MIISDIQYKDIPKLHYSDVGTLSWEDIAHLGRVLGALWIYDYESPLSGFHAELKSGLHSDGFFNMRALLKQENIRMIFATQLLQRVLKECESRIDGIVGVPNGATALAESMATFLGIQYGKLNKDWNGENVFSLMNGMGCDPYILIVEDVCTRGTGFSQAVTTLKEAYNGAIRFVPLCPVILNRGGIHQIFVEGIEFQVVALCEYRLHEWEPQECRLCNKGSQPIAPKASEENWEKLTKSQLL